MKVWTEEPAPTAVRTLAFLFTDIEGSTRLWERFPEVMRSALARHDAILADAVEGAGGQVVKTTGDGIMAVFTTARDGLAACLAAQLALRDAAWGDTGPLRVRMGLHVGEGTVEGGDYHGPAVNRAARIMAAGHGGQVLLSAPTAALVIDQMPDNASVRDLGEHQLKDLARLERVYQLVHPGLPDAFQPLATVDRRMHALPAEPSAFVGREAERARIMARLSDDGVRLLTLTGPGGIGKTRLALRVATDIEGRFSAGAAFVDLSEARDANGLLTTMARSLGFSDTSEEAQLAELTERIGGRELLTVMDNVEQVAAAAPTLAQLLRDCPELKLLVTSRGPLHVRGEHIFPVPPMTLPAPRADVTAEQVGSCEAVRLFVDRAQAVRPDFELSDDNAAVVTDICRRLEGLPLAIELATARLRIFSLEQLRDRLGSRLSALGGGALDLPQRHQTLRATIDWSYQLLTPGEQRLFEVLACFSGNDLAAAEGVSEALRASLADIEAVDGLLSLVDKSLLRQTEAEGQETRFGMLESVREFADERLRAHPELAAEARAAHADWYAGWVPRIVAADPAGGQSSMLARLEVEVENLRAAWRRCVDEHDLDRLQALMTGLWPLHEARGWYRGLYELADDVLAVLGSMPDTPERSLLAVTMRSNQARALTSMQGYSAEVESAYERLLASLEGEDVPQAYPVLRGLASLYAMRAENSRGAEIGRQILRLGREQADPMMQVDGHLYLASGLSFDGRLEDGIPDLEAGVRLIEAGPSAPTRFRVSNDPRVALLTLFSLLLWWQGRLEQSATRSGQAVSLAREVGHPSTLGYALYHASLLSLWRGEPDRARQLAVRVIEVAEEHELQIWKAVGNVVLGAATVALGVDDEGLRWLDEGLDRYRGLKTPPVFWPFLLLVRGDACRRVGRIAEGRSMISEALTLAPHLPDLHLVEGDLLLVAGSMTEADGAWKRALAAARAWGAHMSELRAAVRLVRTAGSTDPAVLASRRVDLRAAIDLFTEGLETPELIEARQLLASA